MSEGSSSQAMDGEGRPPYPGTGGAAPGTPFPWPTDPVSASAVVLQSLAQLQVSVARLEARLECLPAVEQHLAILGSQADSILVLLGRFAGTRVNPEAAALERKRAKEQMEEIERQAKEWEDEQIAAHGGDHPPSEDEARAYREQHGT